MANFDDFLKEVGKSLTEFAKNNWNTYKDAAVKDGKLFIEKSKADIERWLKLLASGGLNRDDFEWLIMGKKDLAELNALKQAGLTKVALDRFINGVIDIIISTAFKTIKV
ncbi:MAG TPA: hypothetical protein DCQ37_11715 [Desulfobacteraceae bacterium]|jgi:hypothetical protein|nr:hypothetical protein [Desulfobacteraceae bacterium]